MNPGGDLSGRVEALEKKVSMLRLLLTGMLTLAVVVVLGAWRMSSDEVIRAKQIIIEDEAGRARMFIGRQSDFGGQRAPSIGMAINDTLGFERFGMGLRPSGRMSMGFDAPLGKGDDRNRERINVIADEEGGAQIRFLDRQTMVKGRLLLTDDDQLVFEFLDFTTDEVRVKRIGFGKDTILVQRRSPSQ